MKLALSRASIKESDAIFVFDVGCSGNYADKINARSVHTLHGRAIPFACGVKIADNKKLVIVNAGDGAVFHEGVNHLIEAATQDIAIVLIVHNNQNFALTKGQKISKNPNFGLNLAKNSGAKFCHLVEKPDIKNLSELFQNAFKHKGFSYIEIIQSCPTFSFGRRGLIQK
ncbi:MAG: thiamine pyrophosphate-dependent enzyme [Candidatus Gracilibacteria bacterium]|nr:thiamine pyrophosphate-dependent enzyme [Candidatus Gracilibacteria bacterium]